MNKFVRFAPVGALALVGASAFAAPIDTTAATTGITEASTAILVVLGAMTGMAIAVYGVKKVLALFGR